MTTYQKHCKLCKKPYESSARNQKYCSAECLDKARGIIAGRTKRRGKYQANKTELRRESLSRKQARELAINLTVSHCCERCKQSFLLKDLELHHIDVNPHNNPEDGLNWSWLCIPCHHAEQAVVTFLNSTGVAWTFSEGRYVEAAP